MTVPSSLCNAQGPHADEGPNTAAELADHLAELGAVLVSPSMAKAVARAYCVVVHY